MSSVKSPLDTSIIFAEFCSKSLSCFRRTDVDGKCRCRVCPPTLRLCRFSFFSDRGIRIGSRPPRSRAGRRVLEFSRSPKFWDFRWKKSRFENFYNFEKMVDVFFIFFAGIFQLFHVFPFSADVGMLELRKDGAVRWSPNYIVSRIWPTVWLKVQNVAADVWFCFWVPIQRCDFPAACLAVAGDRSRPFEKFEHSHPFSFSV